MFRTGGGAEAPPPHVGHVAATEFAKKWFYRTSDAWTMKRFGAGPKYWKG
jgi:hypothetical protein